jgi:hypothetical protein
MVLSIGEKQPRVEIAVAEDEPHYRVEPQEWTRFVF